MLVEESPFSSKFIEVEYDVNYFGGPYGNVGQFVHISEVMIEHFGSVESAFEYQMSLDRCHIIHYSNELVPNPYLPTKGRLDIRV